MAGPRLSLCMIVKNEEDFIDQCLQSVKDAVDEIVIVDTGSTDKTIEICQSYQARIVPFSWNGSFADARNYGIERATGEWILWLDADEEVDEADRGLLRNSTHFDNYDVLTIHLVNYYGDAADKDKTTDIAHTRLFRRDNGITFINTIHECLNIVNLEEERIGHLDVKVYHYGYLDPIVQKKDKFNRNLKMLELQIQEHENIYWAYYYIAMEYYRNHQFNKAFENVNISIRAFLEEKLLPPSMVYKLKYSILIAIGSFEGAWPSIEKAIALYPDYVDLHFFKGIILYYLEKYESAIQTFEHCMEIGEDNINHLVMRGVGSFQAWYYKGLCQIKLNHIEDAVLSFIHALIISPSYQEASDALADIVKKHNLQTNKLTHRFSKEDYQTILEIVGNLS